MKEARIYVDFNEMVEEDLVPLSNTDFKNDSKGNRIELKEGLKVKLYSNDLCSCNETDNLIADGIVELNPHSNSPFTMKWNCRIDKKGINNESQRTKSI